tara:strand:- start:263 stop:1975 length:1713 start_codon:yes stop_codon:yes gene_type:complete
MKKLNLFIFLILITTITSNISTQADINNSLENVINKIKPIIKNKNSYLKLENKAVKKKNSLKDILEFTTQLKKSGELNYKGKTYNFWAQKDNQSIGGTERKVVSINTTNDNTLQILEQYFITYNHDGSIDYFKLTDARDSNKDSWLITDYPVNYEGWASERRYYEDKKKNIQYGGWKTNNSDKWLFGAYQSKNAKSGSEGGWLTWGTKIKYIESKLGLSKKEQKKIYKIAEKRFVEASEVKKLLINLEKKYYAKVLQNDYKSYFKKENEKESDYIGKSGHSQPSILEEIEKEKSLIAIEKEKLELEKAELKKLQEDILNQKGQNLPAEIISTDEKYFALIIGNNDYKYLEKLDAAQKDAEVIADILENKYGFEVNLLLNADHETSVDTLYEVTEKLQKNDNLLIYYAGHGELEKDENRGYWLPVDASYEKKSKWISNQRIVDRIKATKAKHVLLIADSCFSGTLMRSGTVTNVTEVIDKRYIKRLKNKKTRLVITSGGNEPVIDSDGGNHSLFALKLIETLRNSKNVINSQILFENVRRYVVSNADQTPERAMVHKTGHDGGDFLFFPKK